MKVAFSFRSLSFATGEIKGESDKIRKEKLSRCFPSLNSTHSSWNLAIARASLSKSHPTGGGAPRRFFSFPFSGMKIKILALLLVSLGQGYVLVKEIP